MVTASAAVPVRLAVLTGTDPEHREGQAPGADALSCSAVPTTMLDSRVQSEGFGRAGLIGTRGAELVAGAHGECNTRCKLLFTLRIRIILFRAEIRIRVPWGPAPPCLLCSPQYLS